MKRTLVVFEFADEIDAFLAAGTGLELAGPEVRVLAILPEAQARLRQMGVPYHNTYAFFGKKSHEDALLRSDAVYRFCASRVRIEDELGIRDGYKNSFLLYSRFYVHYLLWLVETLSNACAGLEAGELICCPRRGAHPIEPLLHGAEGYAAEIGGLVAAARGLSFRAIPVPERGGPGWAGRGLGALRMLASFAFFHSRMAFRERGPGRVPSILAPSDGYNISRVLDRFQKAFAGVRISYLACREGARARRLLPWRSGEAELLNLPALLPGKRKGAFRERLLRVLDGLRRDPEAAGVFRHREVDLLDLLLRKLAKDVVPALTAQYAQTAHLDRYLERCPPTLVVSQMSRYVPYNLGELCALRGIPSLLISHGSHVPPRNDFEMIEWKEHGLGLMNTPYGHVALQSPWARAYLEKVPTTSTPIVTGPLLFARVAQDRGARARLREALFPGHKDKLLLVQADTPRQRLAMRFFVYQTVDEYVHTLNSLIQCVAQVPRFHLVIRFRPLHYLSMRDIVPLLTPSDCYSIRADGSFEDYLGVADMLTSYSSTTLEEALQNRVPVLQYDPQGKYRHIDGETLSPSRRPRVDSCYYVEGEADLPWALSWLAGNHFAAEAPASLWDRHLFPDAEKQDLPAYFQELFRPPGGGAAERELGVEHGKTDVPA